MLVDPAKLMERRITVCNRLAAGGGGRTEDEWRCTPLTGMWYREASRSLPGDGTVSPSGSVRVQVAEADAAGYVPPASWSGDGWTLRPGDRVLLGELRYSGPYEGLLEAMAAFGPDVAAVSLVRDLRLGEAATGMLGLEKWASVIYAEAA